MAELVFAKVAARATVPPSRPVKAAVSTKELFETFMNFLSFVKFLLCECPDQPPLYSMIRCPAPKSHAGKKYTRDHAYHGHGNMPNHNVKDVQIWAMDFED